MNYIGYPYRLRFICFLFLGLTITAMDSKKTFEYKIKVAINKKDWNDSKKKHSIKFINESFTARIKEEKASVDMVIDDSNISSAFVLSYTSIIKSEPIKNFYNMFSGCESIKYIIFLNHSNVVKIFFVILLLII